MDVEHLNMNFKYLHGVSYANKHFYLTTDFILSYLTASRMTTDDFKTFAYNIENIAKNLNLNNRISKYNKMNVMGACLSALQYNSQKIQDFDIFVNFVYGLYIDYLHQYQDELYETKRNGGRFPNPSDMARKTTIRILEKILTKE